MLNVLFGGIAGVISSMGMRWWNGVNIFAYNIFRS